MLAIPSRQIILSLGLAIGGLVGCASEEAEANESASHQALTADSGGGAGNGPARRAGRHFRDHFAADDVNRDGALTKDEAGASIWKRLSLADSNQDGKVTLDEFRAAHQNGTLGPKGRNGRGEPRGQGRGAGDGRGRGRDNAGKGPWLEQRFAEDDANHDGALSEAEVKAGYWNHIVIADANQDGKVTLAELEAAHQDGTLKPRVGGSRGKKSSARGR